MGVHGKQHVMKFIAQPLTNNPEKVKFFWDRFSTRQFLRRQLSERVENHISLDEYWTDKDDLAIAKILVEAIYKASRINAPLLPDDPLDLVVTVAQSEVGMEWADVIMEVEDSRDCSIFEEDMEKFKTVGDFVAVVKSAPARLPPSPQEKARIRQNRVGCLIILGIIAILILYFIVKSL